MLYWHNSLLHIIVVEAHLHSGVTPIIAGCMEEKNLYILPKTPISQHTLGIYYLNLMHSCQDRYREIYSPEFTFKVPMNSLMS